MANKRVPKDNHNPKGLDYKSLEPLSHTSRLLFVRFVNTNMNIQYPIVTLQQRRTCWLTKTKAFPCAVS